MENILVDRIKTVHLTKKQQLIADYFIKNQDRLASLSSIEVANEIGVSDASVIRFSRLIGFEGYADLKAKLYNKLVENSRSPMSLSERMQANDQKFGNGDISTPATGPTFIYASPLRDSFDSSQKKQARR